MNDDSIGVAYDYSVLDCKVSDYRVPTELVKLNKWSARMCPIFSLAYSIF